jgi:hypothetical protein
MIEDSHVTKPTPIFHPLSSVVISKRDFGNKERKGCEYVPSPLGGDGGRRPDEGGQSKLDIDSNALTKLVFLI